MRDSNLHPSVSIVTIFLNAEPFIEEAIQSVFDQTFHDWELLLVDDGSTDESSEIARAYASQHPDRVFYLEHPNHENRGMSASRNLGIESARGEYIAFLDADDVWLPNKLEEQVSIMSDHPEAGMICGSTLFWHSWDQQNENDNNDMIRAVGADQNAVTTPPQLAVSLYPLGHRTPPNMSNILVRASITQEVGAFVNSFRGMYDDQVFLTKLYLNTPVYVASNCWDLYRRHPNSSLNIARDEGALPAARRRFLQWLENYLLSANITDPDVWKAYRSAVLPYKHPVRYRIKSSCISLLRLARQTALTILPESLSAKIRKWKRSINDTTWIPQSS